MVINLRKVPQDVSEIVLREQKKLKVKKEVLVFSKEMTVYHIIRQFAKKCQEENP
jgi:hypothetical protein